MRRMWAMMRSGKCESAGGEETRRTMMGMTMERICSEMRCSGE